MADSGPARGLPRVSSQGYLPLGGLPGRPSRVARASGAMLYGQASVRPRNTADGLVGLLGTRCRFSARLQDSSWRHRGRKTGQDKLRTGAGRDGIEFGYRIRKQPHNGIGCQHWNTRYASPMVMPLGGSNEPTIIRRAIRPVHCPIPIRSARAGSAGTGFCGRPRHRF
jgi:hypothetical protein